MLGLHIGLRVLKLCFQDHANLLQVVVIVPPLLLDLHLQSFTLLVQSLELLELLLSESRDLLPLTFVLPLLLRHQNLDLLVFFVLMFVEVLDLQVLFFEVDSLSPQDVYSLP